MTQSATPYAPTQQQLDQARERSLLPIGRFQEQHPPAEPFIEHTSAMVHAHPASRFRIVEERTHDMGYGMDREEQLSELGLSGGIEDSKGFAAELLQVLSPSLTLRNLRDLHGAIAESIARWEGEIRTHAGQPQENQEVAASTPSAVGEARRLGLRVTFGPEEVSEAGGFGVPYAAHGDDASLAFAELVQLAGESP